MPHLALKVHISKDLTWTHNTCTIMKTARLFFLHMLRRLNMDSFSRYTTEGIHTDCITTLNHNPLEGGENC